MNGDNLTAEPPADHRVSQLRRACHGVAPLDARLEPWMVELLTSRRDEVREAIEAYGSPVNVLHTPPLKRQIERLNHVAAERDLPFRVYFARKANKCLSFVDSAVAAGAGIDVASEQECRQVLDRGLSGDEVICTAAIKTERLIRQCLQNSITMAIDNFDEFDRVVEIAHDSGHQPVLAIRVSGFQHDGEKLWSRFGFDVDDIPALTEYLSRDQHESLKIAGLHFHLDGYCPRQRMSAIHQCLPIIDALRSRGQPLKFLDMGGGIPMCYLTSETQWQDFWRTHRESLLGKREPITYRNHGLGLVAHDGEVSGRRNVYPFYQRLIQDQWLAMILDAQADETGSKNRTLADALRHRDLQLRCEPGRSVLDGCGLTVAKVEFTKQNRCGDWFIGLAMNHTQCRTSSDDFLVDPILLRSDEPACGDEWRTPGTGYLVGTYCTESDLLSLRKLQFPQGVTAGDLVVFPNTAGYLMHFKESRSHQFPLAGNLFVDGPSDFRVDDVDLPRSSNR